jgi:hypothetical protein
MDIRPLAGSRAGVVPAADPETTDEALLMCQRHNDRARFWRMILGVLGLFWVSVLLLLMG